MACSTLQDNKPLLKVGAAVIHYGSVLLVKATHCEGNNLASSGWDFPSGEVGLGETLRQAVCREVKIQTGISVEAGKLLTADEQISSDSQQGHEVTLILEARYLNGELDVENESVQPAWVSSMALITMDVDTRCKHLLNELGFIDI